MCVTVYTLHGYRHLFSGFLTVAESCMERYWGPILWIPVCLNVCIVKLRLFFPVGVSLMSALGCMCVLLCIHWLGTFFLNF